MPYEPGVTIALFISYFLIAKLRGLLHVKSYRDGHEQTDCRRMVLLTPQVGFNALSIFCDLCESVHIDGDVRIKMLVPSRYT